jgi:hypothetical protein
MKPITAFLGVCGVMLLAFALYVSAPLARSVLLEGWGTPPVPAQTGNPIPLTPKPTASRIIKPAVLSSTPTDTYTETPPDLEPPKVPVSKSVTVSFMPGQAVDIPNRRFRKVEVHSEYPIRVLTGNCHVDYSVEFFCTGDPSDIFITDLRKMPVFLTPRGNLITMNFIEF